MTGAGIPSHPGRRKDVLSILGFLVAVAAIVDLILHHRLIASNPLAIGVQVLSAMLMVWARSVFGMRSFFAAARPTAGALVTDGPYRWWRHPIYAAIVYFCWAGVVSNWSPRAGIAASVLTAGLLLRMAMEESLLIATYPEYRDYAGRTKRLIPYVL